MAMDQNKIDQMNKAVDEWSAIFLKEAKDTTNEKKPEKIRQSVPADIMKKALISQGVDKESINNLASALTVVSRSAHHASALRLRDAILEHRNDKEFIDKATVSTRGEILPGYMRLNNTIEGRRSGMTVPREGSPSKPYTTYGNSRTVIDLTTPTNKQRESDADMIRETYEGLDK